MHFFDRSFPGPCAPGFAPRLNSARFLIGPTLFFLLQALTVFAAPSPRVLVTDVTPRSFSLVVAGSEPFSSQIAVYDDPAGQLPSAGIQVDQAPYACNAELQAVSTALGLAKITVTGLGPAEQYFFRVTVTPDATGQPVTLPADGNLSAVTTAAAVHRSSANLRHFGNDLLTTDWYLADGVTPADGTLLFAAVTGAGYPVTHFVGDCAPSGQAILDLNNYYTITDGSSLDLDQGTVVNLLLFRGRDGLAQRVVTVPADAGLTEVVAPGPFLHPGGQLFATQVVPRTPAPPEFFTALWPEFAALWRYAPAARPQWQAFRKDVPAFLNRLQAVEAAVGYWLVLEPQAGGDSLLVEGSAAANLEPLPPRRLHSGWNLIGAREYSALPVTEAMASLSSMLQSVWTQDSTVPGGWISYRPGDPPESQQLRYIEPGKAYWVELAADCDAQPVACVW